MKSGRFKKLIAIIVALGLAGGLGWLIYGRLEQQAVPGRRGGAAGPVPVDVAAIERGPIELHRTFSGTLEAGAEFVVAPKVSGRTPQHSSAVNGTVNTLRAAMDLDNA